jgi:hypothetical protein
LVDDAKGLTELFHAAKVAVVTVSVNTHRDIKLDLVICVIGLRLSDIPGYAGSSKHDTREGVVDGIGG